MVGHLSNLFPSAGVSAMTTYLSLLYGVELTQPNYNEILLCNVYHIVATSLPGKVIIIMRSYFLCVVNI